MKPLQGMWEDEVFREVERFCPSMSEEPWCRLRQRCRKPCQGGGPLLCKRMDLDLASGNKSGPKRGAHRSLSPADSAHF